MGETSIPCSAETRDRLRDDKPDGVSWDKYLIDLLDGDRGGSRVDISSVESSLSTIEERTGRIERELEGIKRGGR